LQVHEFPSFNLRLGLSRKAGGGGENKTGASNSGSGGGRTKADKLAAAGEGSRHITDFFPIRFEKNKFLTSFLSTVLSTDDRSISPWSFLVLDSSFFKSQVLIKAEFFSIWILKHLKKIYLKVQFFLQHHCLPMKIARKKCRFSLFSLALYCQ
jgi:hypothetical protein